MPRCERSRLGAWCYLCGRLVGAGAVEDDGYWWTFGCCSRLITMAHVLVLVKPPA